MITQMKLDWLQKKKKQFNQRMNTLILTKIKNSWLNYRNLRKNKDSEDFRQDF